MMSFNTILRSFIFDSYWKATNTEATAARQNMTNTGAIAPAVGRVYHI